MISIAKPYIGDEEKKLVMEVLESGMLAQGPKVAALEEAFAELCDVKHAIATTSGTTALHMGGRFFVKIDYGGFIINA